MALTSLLKKDCIGVLIMYVVHSTAFGCAVALCGSSLLQVPLYREGGLCLGVACVQSRLKISI
jgi:hypothetical protein